MSVLINQWHVTFERTVVNLTTKFRIVRSYPTITIVVKNLKGHLSHTDIQINNKVTSLFIFTQFQRDSLVCLYLYTTPRTLTTGSFYLENLKWKNFTILNSHRVKSFRHDGNFDFFFVYSQTTSFRSSTNVLRVLDVSVYNWFCIYWTFFLPLATFGLSYFPFIHETNYIILVTKSTKYRTWTGIKTHLDSPHLESY